MGNRKYFRTTWASNRNLSPEGSTCIQSQPVTKWAFMGGKTSGSVVSVPLIKFYHPFLLFYLAREQVGREKFEYIGKGGDRRESI